MYATSAATPAARTDYATMEARAPPTASPVTYIFDVDRELVRTGDEERGRLRPILALAFALPPRNAPCDLAVRLRPDDSQTYPRGWQMSRGSCRLQVRRLRGLRLAQATLWSSPPSGLADAAIGDFKIGINNGSKLLSDASNITRWSQVLRLLYRSSPHGSTPANSFASSGKGGR